MIGIGWRSNLAAWIRGRPAGLECLEIIPDHFMDGGTKVLEQLTADYPLCLHGLSCSLATPGPLDGEYASSMQRIARICKPRWASEHIAFTRAGGIDLGHLNPVPPTHANLKILVEHARELQERLELPLLLENITSSLRMEGDMPENEFIAELCRQAECGLLLDVTNLFINSRNHGFDPRDWLAPLPRAMVRQLHVVGYAQDASGKLHDSHDQLMQPDLLELIAYVIRNFEPEAVILERDDSAAAGNEIAAELEALHALH
ncbi:DUF692 family protein [bacterium]|nr:DUF692 family protein [bacterium]